MSFHPKNHLLHSDLVPSSLLITLAIFKALVTECRRDISLLSASLISSVNTALAALPTDLELSAKAASVVRKHVLLQK